MSRTFVTVAFVVLAAAALARAQELSPASSADIASFDRAVAERQRKKAADAQADPLKHQADKPESRESAPRQSER